MGMVSNRKLVQEFYWGDMNVLELDRGDGCGKFNKGHWGDP